MSSTSGNFKSALHQKNAANGPAKQCRHCHWRHLFFFRAQKRCIFSIPVLWQHRTIRQAELAEKIRRSARTQLCGVALYHPSAIFSRAKAIQKAILRFIRPGKYRISDNPSPAHSREWDGPVPAGGPRSAAAPPRRPMPRTGAFSQTALTA